MNENNSNVVSIGNTNDIDIDSSTDTDLSGGLDTQAYYDYDYRNYLQTIIDNQNEILTESKKSNEICNSGFTTLLFCLISVFCYVLVKNYIRK